MDGGMSKKHPNFDPRRCIPSATTAVRSWRRGGGRRWKVSPSAPTATSRMLRTSSAVPARLASR